MFAKYNEDSGKPWEIRDSYGHMWAQFETKEEAERYLDAMEASNYPRKKGEKNEV